MMIQVPGYSHLSRLQDNPRVVVYRAQSERLGSHVILKVLRTEFPTVEEIEAFENEFQILSENPSPGLPKAIDLIQVDKTRIMVLEDIGGVSLSQHLVEKASPAAVPGLLSLIDLSISISSVLAKIHDQDIIHCDLKPDNIIYNISTHRIQVIDFGLAVKGKTGERVKEEKLKKFRGTLQYVSPEQTGRVNRVLDYRSDYYNLGVTFYQMFSGRLPFQAQDPMEWVHNHLAQIERPVHELIPGFPIALSQVIQKLMKKSPDQRYQSSLGLLHDLRRIRELVAAGVTTEDFVVGQRDLSAEFKISSRLYGRENEMRFLKQTIARTISGGKRMVMIEGDPGVGKSTIVNMTRENVSQSQGYFLTGKYDQFRQEVPFSAMIQVFNQLVSQILMEPKEKIDRWRERIISALGENAGVVAEVVPRIELIIGQSSPIPHLRGQESRQRFQITFHNFIRACALRGQPIVMFLDDLQWADSASRALIQTILTEEKAESLLLLGAYRGKDVDDTHPLRFLMNDLKERGLQIDSIRLGDLNQSQVQSLIEDSFSTSAHESAKLAELVFEKTQGNPFFVTQFLRDLFEKKIIHFEGLEGWKWSLESIQKENVTSNVLTLMSQKILSLPKATQEVLQLASCFGNHFNIEELKTYNHKTDYENTSLLEKALQAGLIHTNDHGSYRFIHDRVQEAAYLMISQVRRQEIHWRIADYLIKTWSPNKVKDSIFYLVNHWNLGSGLISTDDERERSAELNLLAAQRSKDSSVYDLALKYAKTGESLLRSSDWDRHFVFLKQLNLIQAECEYILGNFERARSIFDTLLIQVKNNLERARIYKTMVDLAYMNGQYDEAIRLGTIALKTLKFHLPKNPSKLRILWMILAVRHRIKKIGVQNIPYLPDLKNERDIELISLLTHVGESAYFVNKPQFAFIGLSVGFNILRSGVKDPVTFAFLAAILWNKMNRIGEAEAALQVGLKIGENFPHPIYLGRSLFLSGGFTTHVTMGLKEALRMLERSYVLLIQGGDLAYGSFCAFYLGFMSFLSARKLSFAESELKKYHEVVMNNNDKMISDCLYSFVLTVKALSGKTKNPTSFTSDSESEDDLIKRFSSHKTGNPVAWLASQKVLLLYIMGCKKEALSYLTQAKEQLEATPFSAASIVNQVVCGLLIVQNLNEFKGLEKIRQKIHLRSSLRKLRAMAEFNPRVYDAPYLLLQAAVLRHRRKFDKALQVIEVAIRTSKTCDVILYEALANELAAEIFFDKGLHKVALLYVKEALFVYDNWGASAKVQRLRELHPELSIQQLKSEMQPNMSFSPSASTRSNLNLDIETVLKATNTLISEINMETLVQKLLNTMIENAGADRGLLLMFEKEKYIVRGDVVVDKKDAFRLTRSPLETVSEISKSIVEYVGRTQEAVVFDSAHDNDLFSRDEYLRKRSLLSIICVPIVNQGELKGIMYLENNNSESVFSSERAELIRVLSGQAAISLENAKLYETQAEKIRMENELATAQTVQENLFPEQQGRFGSVDVQGFYRPASECGGDWWYYSDIGDDVFVWAGDATGHGAPAALVTSAACSTVAVIEKNSDLSPGIAMSHLNRSIYRTTHGKINMTFFVGALNKKTGVFRYSKASHDAPIVLRKKQMQKFKNFQEFRTSMEYLLEPNGPRLGAQAEIEFVEGQIQLEPGDCVLIYTDGLPEIQNPGSKMWGDRAFLSAVYEGFLNHERAEDIVQSVICKSSEFQQNAPMMDDVTMCLIQYHGQESLKRVA